MLLTHVILPFLLSSFVYADSSNVKEIRCESGSGETQYYMVSLDKDQRGWSLVKTQDAQVLESYPYCENEGETAFACHDDVDHHVILKVDFRFRIQSLVQFANAWLLEDSQKEPSLLVCKIN